MFYGSLVSFCIASALLLIAALLGSTFEKLSATGRTIGSEEPETEESEMQSLTDDDASGDAEERRVKEPLQQLVR